MDCYFFSIWACFCSVPLPITEMHPSRFTAWAIPLVILLLGAAVYWLYQWDPEGTAFAPKCSFYLLSGYYCPGCGAQRALHALLHGDIHTAWRNNPLLLFLLPYLLLGIALNLYGSITGREYRWAIFYHRQVIRLLLALLIVYWIARNLPWYPFPLLAPP